MKVLIIEDEKLLADSIQSVLERKGFEVECVYDGETGAEYAELGIYDLLILDVMMPKLNGCQVARQVRVKRCGHPYPDADRPVRLGGPHRGAQRRGGLLPDQALRHPGAAGLHQRPAPPAGAARWIELTAGKYRSGSWTPAPWSAGEKRVRLSAREFDVMRFLLQRPEHRILSKEVILARVWGYDSNAVENHVEVYVGFLRKKLAQHRFQYAASRPVRRLGYRLEVDEEC